MSDLRDALALGALCTLLLGGVGSPSEAGVVLTALDAAALDTNARSVTGDRDAAILFVNDLDFAVDLYWIDYDGHRVFYYSIAAGTSELQRTFITHPWVLVGSGTGGTEDEGSGQLLAGFLPQTDVPADGDDHDVAHLRALRVGDIVAADGDSGGGGLGALVRIDPRTGSHSIVTRGGSPIGSTGLVMIEPKGVALGADGLLYVVDPQRRGRDGLLVRVNPVTGEQSLVARGGLLEDPMDLAVEGDGQIVIANSSDYRGAPSLVRVNPATGAQSLLASGGWLGNPWGVVVEPGGDLLVASRGYRSHPAIVRVDPRTGAQTLVTGALDDPMKLAIDSAGRIVIVESGVRFAAGGRVPLPPRSRPRLVGIDPVTGAIRRFTPRGLAGGYFRSVAVDADGRVLVGENRDDNAGTVYGFDGDSGTRSVLLRSNGFPLNDPTDLFVIAGPVE
jgi:hypothetical protein